MSQTVLPRLRRCLLLPAVVLGWVMFFVPSLAAQPKPRVVSSQAAPERTHQLFVGIDLFVPTGSQMMQVRNIDGHHTTVVSEQGQPSEIERTSGFRWKLVPKVSNQDASISDLQYETTYSPAKDPYKQWVGRQTNIMNYQQDQSMMAELKAAGASLTVVVADQNGNVTRTSGEDVRPELFHEMRALQNEQQMLNDLTRPDSIGKNADEGAEAPGHDAMQLQFNVSAPTPMAHAYCIALARLRKADGEIEDVNFYKALGEIGPKPRKVTFLQTGITPGAKILDVKLHLFNSGKELATNLSEKRFDLTADEARQYLLLDHTANHRGETLPARPVWELAPPELKAVTQPAELDLPVLVNIDEQGRLTGFASQEQIVTPRQREMIGKLVFLPALDEGQAVASTVSVNLADYFR